MKNFIAKSLINIFILILLSLSFSALVYVWFGSIALTITFLILLIAFIIVYPKRGGKVRRNAVDELSQYFIVSKNCLEHSVSSVKGVGILGNTNQPMHVNVSKEGISLYFWCYRRKPEFILPWENVVKVVLIEKNGKFYASLKLNHFNQPFIVPWKESFKIPQNKSSYV